MVEVTAAKIAVVAWTAAVLLTEPGMILHRYWLALDRLKGRGLAWLAYPLGYCEKCLAGQIALWTYLAQQYLHPDNSTTLVEKSAEGIYFVCITVFLTSMITWLTPSND